MNQQQDALAHAAGAFNATTTMPSVPLSIPNELLVRLKVRYPNVIGEHKTFEDYKFAQGQQEVIRYIETLKQTHDDFVTNENNNNVRSTRCEDAGTSGSTSNSRHNSGVWHLGDRNGNRNVSR